MGAARHKLRFFVGIATVIALLPGLPSSTRAGDAQVADHALTLNPKLARPIPPPGWLVDHRQTWETENPVYRETCRSEAVADEIRYLNRIASYDEYLINLTQSYLVTPAVTPDPAAVKKAALAQATITSLHNDMAAADSLTARLQALRPCNGTKAPPPLNLPAMAAGGAPTSAPPVAAASAPAPPPTTTGPAPPAAPQSPPAPKLAAASATKPGAGAAETPADILSPALDMVEAALATAASAQATVAPAAPAPTPAPPASAPAATPAPEAPAPAPAAPAPEAPAPAPAAPAPAATMPAAPPPAEPANTPDEASRLVIRFADNKPALTPSGIRAFDEAVAALRGGKTVQLAIEGCGAGADFSNGSTCARRRLSLREMLLAKGVRDPARALRDIR